VPSYHLGIDIGGTFTDLSLFDSETGHLLGLKTATIPADPARGVANGLELLAERGVALDEIGYFVHGTTIGVNAIIQRRGARIALLVTAGFRDVLELARLRLPTPWDFNGHRPAPLLPRELVLPVRERMRHTGAVETPLTEEEIARVVAGVRAFDVEGVAICLLHAYANPVHERALRDALRAGIPGLFVSSSSEVWPQVREYERSLVTVMNAYVRPPLDRYLGALETTLQERGVPARPYLTRSNGGIMTTTAARAHPVQTLLSGPASGVTGALGVARAAGLRDVITFDMGGTSADVALVTGGAVELSREARVGDFPLFLPVVGVASIGAGGGSIAWLDGSGVLKVGPRSAGADPGPACYGLGGAEPTLTDAFLLSGYLNPERFAGRVRLDEEAARAAVTPLADALGLTIEETAGAIERVALATMYTELSGVLEQRGVDPREFTLVAFGGAGPVVACRLAAEMNIPRVLVPVAPGTLSALGALQADVAADFIRSVHWPLAAAMDDGVRRAVEELETQARDWLADEAPAVQNVDLRWSADMRYVGQSHEIETPLPAAPLHAGETKPLAEALHAAHLRLFNHNDPAAAVEMINLRLRASGQLPQRLENGPRIDPRDDAGPSGSRDILGNGATHAAIYARDALGSGQRITGPAIVEQTDTTTVIPPGWVGVVDPFGNLAITLDADL
jgi:N-methylhydantoinase A